MLVWGGAEGGGCYSPATDAWRAMNTNGMPASRFYLSSAWSGKDLIVWGGQDGFNTLRDDGGRYDPLTDTWLPTTTSGTPTGRHEATAVWIGDAMLFFGGWAGGASYVNDLWSYQPPDVFSGDGLPDDWQHTYFGTPWTEDALLNADPDGDGQPNHYELTAGTDPTNALSQFTVALEIDVDHRPRLKLSGLALDRRISVQWRTHLANPIFQPVSNFQIETQNQSIIVTDLETVSGTRFYQVQLLR